MGLTLPSLYQITNCTLSSIIVILEGNGSHGKDTSNPAAVCTSDSGPVMKDENNMKLIRNFQIF